jgi:transposase-like protein
MGPSTAPLRNHVRSLPIQCFKTFYSAERALEGIDAVNMLRKSQVKRLAGSDAMAQAKFVAPLFQIAA